MMQQRVLGVMAGGGLYQTPGLQGVKRLEVDTPFGAPSEHLVKGILQVAPVVFVARHRKGHPLSSSEINHHANVCALKSLGVTPLLSSRAVGSPHEHLVRGDELLGEQFIEGLSFPLAQSPRCVELGAATSSGGPICRRPSWLGKQSCVT